MMRIVQERLRELAAMAGMANNTTDTPRRRLRCAATRVSYCVVREPGHDEKHDRWN
jgi:hypothetical protein